MDPSVLKDKTILIVDDYKVNAELVGFSVSDAGAVPLVAFNGKECIEIIIKQHVDVILMDHHMPVMDGIEATKIIRTLSQGKDILIIGISADGNGAEEKDCIEAGMNLVVEKLTLNCEKLIEISEPFFKKVPCPKEQDHFMNEISTSPSDKKCDLNDQIIMDYEKALREFEFDNELLLSLMEDFNQNIHSQLISMKKAIDIKDYSCIQSESHGIKGGAANLCAMPLSEAAKSLEKACKQSADDKIIFSLLENLEADINLFDEFVGSTLSKYKIP